MIASPPSGFIRLAGSLLLGAAVLGAGPDSRAGQEFPDHGGPGGAPFRAECPAWSHVVGFTGRIGAWLISIEPICAPLQPLEQRIGAGAPNGQRFGGGSGGNPYSVSCPVGYALGSWVFDMVVNSDMDPTFVNAIGLECRLVGSPGQTYKAQVGDDLGAILTKDVAVIAQMGWDRPTFTHQCPPGELARGIRGRAGVFIDALGLTCGAPPTAQEAAACNAYRDAALQAVADNQSLQCGHGGDRWSGDAGLHMAWCMGLGADRAAATNTETAARADAIQKCRWAKTGIRERVLTDAVVQSQPEVAVQARPRADRAVLASQPEPMVQGPPKADVVAESPKPIRRLGKRSAAVGADVAVQAPSAGMASAMAGTAVAGPAVAAAPGSFEGGWNTRTDKNWTYDIRFAQQGHEVSGTYVVQNGTQGRIRGTVQGNVLSFQWDQDGGYTGTGQFTLASDGNSFEGSYRTDPNPTLTPDLLQGTWKGTRK